MATPARRTTSKKPSRVAAKNATVRTAREAGVPTTATGAIDLGALERTNPVEPLYFSLEGDEFVVADPSDRAWQDLIVADPNSLPQVLRSYLGDEDYERFSAHPLPLWKIRTFDQLIKKHFGLDPATQGNGPASPTS